MGVLYRLDPPTERTGRGGVGVSAPNKDAPQPLCRPVFQLKTAAGDGPLETGATIDNWDRLVPLHDLDLMLKFHRESSTN